MNQATLLILLFGIASAFGSEQFQQRIILSATTKSPLGAAGKVELQAETEGTNTSADLELETEGLLPGAYTLLAEPKSSGEPILLGTFNLDDEEALALPAEFNPLDMARISVVNPAGDVVLTGEPVRETFRARVPFVGANSVAGRAQLTSTTRNGIRVSRFRMTATGAPPNTELMLKVNGTDVGMVLTDKHGGVKLNGLPRGFDPDSLVNIEFEDPDTNVVLKLEF
jgi:hypothetical protein